MDIRWRLRMAAAQREVGPAPSSAVSWRSGRGWRCRPLRCPLCCQAAGPVEAVHPGGICTALECSPNDLLEVDTTPVEAKARPAKAATAPARPPQLPPRRPGAVDAADMRIADCVRCGAGVGHKAEVLCCRCRAADREAQRRANCPVCNEFLRLDPTTGRCVRCSRTCADCGHVLRFKSSVRCLACRRRFEAAAAKSPCPRCGRPGISEPRPAGAGHARGHDRRCRPGRALFAGCSSAKRAKACAAAAGRAAQPVPSTRRSG